ASHDSADSKEEPAQHEEHEPYFVMEYFDKDSDDEVHMDEVHPMDNAQAGAFRDMDKNEVDAIGNPKDDTSIGVSRDVLDMEVEDDATDPNDDVLIGASRDIADGHGMQIIVYRGDPTAPAVKCILYGMEEQNRGITELSEHLESKIFTEDQKESMMFLRLDEIKTHLRSLSTTTQRTLLSVVEAVKKDMKSLSEDIKTKSTILELKVEQSGMDLKHLVEQKFLENDIRL
ncbi:hypothetical protein Dimus_008091, partial [Dionaea muscipula]